VIIVGFKIKGFLVVFDGRIDLVGGFQEASQEKVIFGVGGSQGDGFGQRIDGINKVSGVEGGEEIVHLGLLFPETDVGGRNMSGLVGGENS